LQNGPIEVNGISSPVSIAPGNGGGVMSQVLGVSAKSTLPNETDDCVRLAGIPSQSIEMQTLGVGWLVGELVGDDVGGMHCPTSTEIVKSHGRNTVGAKLVKNPTRWTLD